MMTIQDAQRLRYGAQKVEVKVYPDWIPVEHCLPEKSGWYLVANPNVQTSFYFIEPDHVGRTNEFIDEGVTHWMPLPEGPTSTT